jgi:hypothetical protein
VADGIKPKVSIRWNGRDVSDPSELPPEVRKLLEDADGNGIPDIAESGKAGGLKDGDQLEVETVTSTVVDVDGKTYHGIDELPPEMREAAREALSRAMQSGQPVVAKRVHSLDASPPSKPRPVGPSWALVLFAALAGAVLMYVLLRPHH